jgi:negative regulator of replication initiation
MRAGWNVPDDIKRDCVAQLASIAAGAEKDSDRVAAIKALMTADAIDQKREANEHARRLQLLELARRIDPRALAEHASKHGIVGADFDGGNDRIGSGQDTQGDQA